MGIFCRSLDKIEPPENTETSEKTEERAFADFIRGKVTEMRAGEQNITMGNNGAVIPESIANRIIDTVTELCPIFFRCRNLPCKRNAQNS